MQDPKQACVEEQREDQGTKQLRVAGPIYQWPEILP
jgi:hypothetical protein